MNVDIFVNDLGLPASSAYLLEEVTAVGGDVNTYVDCEKRGRPSEPNELS